jgi:hypothetical protein
MPQMDGIGFLNEAREVYPDGKRALLTAYADTLPTVYRFENSKAQPALTPSVAQSLTSRLGRDLILIGPGWHTEFRNGLGCSDLAGFCDAQESACIQSFKTCCYERKT